MLLLVRLLLPAASYVAASSSDVEQLSRTRQLRSQRLSGRVLTPLSLTGDPSEGFHERDSQVPDAAGQSFKTTVKCTKERQDLAKQLDRLLSEEKQFDKQCETELRYYKEMIALTQQQIDRVKVMVAERKDESDLPPMFKAQYTAIMCAKIHDGFVMDDSRARLEVNDICDGRKSLIDCKLESLEPLVEGDYETQYVTHKKLRVDTPAPAPVPAPAPAAADGTLASTPRIVAPTTKTATFFRASPSMNRLATVESPECFQATATQQQVDATKKSTKAKKKACAKEKAELKADLEKKRQREDALWTEYHGHISQKKPIREREAEKVKVKFCTVVQQTPPGTPGCNNDRRSIIQAFYVEHCIPSLMITGLAN